jgi:hypothetical protein
MEKIEAANICHQGYEAVWKSSSGEWSLNRKEQFKKLEKPYTMLDIFHHMGVFRCQRLEPDSISVLGHLKGELSL